MKKKAVFGLVVVVMMVAAGCGGGGSVTVEKLAEKLGKMKPNTADTPYTVKLDATVNITAKMDSVLQIVQSEGKYVILDISDCAAKDNTIDRDSHVGGEYVKGIILPKTLTAIGYGAFYRSEDLATVSIPSGVTLIGPTAFSQCGLTSVTIPASVAEIGWAAFSQISSLESVTFADGSNIPDDKFGAAAFPPNEMNVGGFRGSNALKDAYLANGAGTYTFNRDTRVWTKE
jgi:hypothetical protein